MERIGLNGATLPGRDLLTKIRAAASAGFGFYEPRVPELLAFDTPDGRCEVVEAMAECGLGWLPLNALEGVFAVDAARAGMILPLAARFGVPIVVTGFEPSDILRGIYLAVDQLERGRAEVENAYARAVTRRGNLEAQRLIEEVFERTDRKWRGLGEIPGSGLKLREKYSEFDAESRFGLADLAVGESAECISGLILQGRKKPHECAAYGRSCTPEHPLGATMVSSEGSCAAYYRYRRFRPENQVSSIRG